VPGPRVLLVDDDPALRRTAERVLRLADYEVALAEGGRDALDALGGSEFSLVVLDVAMPPPDGLEVLRRMRAGGDDTPVLFAGTGCTSFGARWCDPAATGSPVRSRSTRATSAASHPASTAAVRRRRRPS
jgi:chemotaxis response regulator CheB